MRTAHQDITCTGCRDRDEHTCAHCEAFRVTGSPEAAAACFVRLSDLGWRIHTEQVEISPETWQVQVDPPAQRRSPDVC